jgi:hypothetical protein
VSSESLILNAFFLINSVNLSFFADAEGWPTGAVVGYLPAPVAIFYVVACNAWIVHSFRDVYRTKNPNSIWMLRVWID